MDTHPAKYKKTRSAGRTGLSCTDNPDELTSGRRDRFSTEVGIDNADRGGKLKSLNNKNHETLV